MQAKIAFIKGLDRILGSLMAYLLPSARVRSVEEVRHILVIRPGGIGDAVLLVPMLLDLKELFPRARVTVLAERRNCAVFTLTDAVDELCCYDRAGDVRTLLTSRYDVIIDTEQWHRLTAVLGRLLRPALAVGFGTNGRRRLFTHVVGYSHDDYEADSFHRLLEPLRGKPRQGFVTPFLLVPPTAQERADALLGELAGQPFVTVFPGASIPERRWSAANFRELAQALHARRIPVVVIGGGEDRAEGEAIAAGGLGLQLAGMTTLVESAAVLARTTVLVSGDTGILHMGVGLGRTTVSLFGPGIALKWAPRGGRHRTVSKGNDCSPCTRFGYTPRCPFAARCIRDITVTEVLAAVTELWSQQTAVGSPSAGGEKNPTVDKKS
jgi:ADP-heptose:LPS heptosyltransferase